MTHRILTSDTDQYPSVPAWNPPQPGSYAPPDQRGHHAHDGERELHAQGDRPHYHDPDSGILVFFDPAASAPNEAATEVDPTPAGTPGAVGAAPVATAPDGPAPIGSGSGAAGAGRPRDALGRFISKGPCPRRLEPRPEYASLKEWDGDGRPVRRELLTLPVSVALEHALIDRDADLFLAAQHHKLRMARTVLDAIAFGVEADRLEDAMAMYAGMLVRLPSDNGRRP